MSTQIEIRQSEQYEGGDWWKWAVWLEGDEEALDQVEWVEWTLHPTFPNPVRKCHNRAEKFKLESAGWGVFPIRARVWTKDGRSTKLEHHLKLHYNDGKENTA
ncbi:MAG TPA: pYEATS domain-containing protein [Pyrinomonadaceae bacterium]|jgi:transcription initiation factor IIF auxiliary subunit|nr:pYEATS domain-containing protein [Pyrinomonadaceae bacterium]